MNEQLATIKRVADTLIATRDKELDRLRSENAELRAALEMMRDEYMKLPHSLGYSFTHLPKVDAILERTKK